MLLQRISLQNFRAFRGQHDIELAPESPQQPIVLFTGLNGAGKTTILEALYLVLYGKRTPSPRRSGQVFERYLEECMHRSATHSEESSVGLSFSLVMEGEPVVFDLLRSWSKPRATIRERLKVVVNGIEDSMIRDDWGQQIEELLPSRLAPLFFFDGEKIESLADFEETSQVLSVAIHSLLGLDLVDQLNTDLELLERKKATNEAPDLDRELEHLAETKDSASAAMRKAFQERASVKGRLEQAKILLERREQAYETRGGLAFERRAELEASSQEAERSLEESRQRLRDLASKKAPLLLVPGLLERVSAQIEVERKARESRLLSQLLAERDRDLLVVLRPELGASSSTAVEAWLDHDRAQRIEKQDAEEVLRVSEAGAIQLSHLLEFELPELNELIEHLLKDHQASLQAWRIARKRLAGIPEEGSLQDVRSQRAEAQERVAKLEAELGVRTDALQAAQRAEKEAERRLQAAHLRNVKASEGIVTTRRLIKHSSRVRETLGVFREKVLRRHIERIQELVLEGLNQLLRKERLVTALEISPEDFSVRLVGSNGETLPPELLSAGERQLLAIALLWGLARAARRPMPTLIDTPLGRLDSVHRRHLVDRYFPFASHQVILLSTDEEIAGELLDRLRPRIGRSYVLEHDDTTGTSQTLVGFPGETVVAP